MISLRLDGQPRVNEDFMDNAIDYSPSSSLTDLRRRIDAIDETILALVADRVELVKDIQRLKHAIGLPVRSHERERDMFARARRIGSRLGIAGDDAVIMIRQCIASCLSAAGVDTEDDPRAAG